MRNFCLPTAPLSSYHHFSLQTSESAMASATAPFPSLFFPFRNPKKTLAAPSLRLRHLPRPSRPFPFRGLAASGRGSAYLHRLGSVSNQDLSASTSTSGNYEFSDGNSEVELKLDLSNTIVENTGDIFIETDDFSLRVRVHTPSSIVTLLQASQLYDRITPSETIWYIDEDYLVISLKKRETELKWPDLVESWESLKAGVPQLLKGTPIYLVGDCTEINQMVAKDLASGIRYIPLITSELLEEYAKQPFDSWVIAEGEDSVAEAEGAVLESLSSHVRTVVGTLGGRHGMARRPDNWRYLFGGVTIWLSLSEATDEASAKEETRRNIQENLAYSNSEVVLKLGGWEPESAHCVAQACLSAIKKFLLSDKQLIGKKSLYVRSGCRGDWPNIQPPGWDPSMAGTG